MEQNGASSSHGQGGQNNNMLEQTQQQVNEVVGIMRVNVEKVLERDQKLSELDSRADALQEGGKRFEQQAQKLKRKYWWKNLKMMIILGIIAVVILIIIIVSVTDPFSSSDDNTAEKDGVAVTSTGVVSDNAINAQNLPAPSNKP